MFIHSGNLYHVATTAYHRAKVSSKHDRSPDTSEPQISVLFAAAACEAFISEIGLLAAMPEYTHQIPELPKVKSLARILDTIEDGRSTGTIMLKFHLSKFVLSGEAYDKGEQLFQDFALLLDLRNCLAHMKYDTIHPPAGTFKVT